MIEEKKKEWTFLGFQSEREGRPVQVWFYGLDDEAKDEIRDLVRYLRYKVASRWQRPSFDALKGADGISELRAGNIVLERDGEIKKVTYRIYGFHGPKGIEFSYTFLHGTEKGVTNDRQGKRIAQRRLKEIEGGWATVHTFDFED